MHHAAAAAALVQVSDAAVLGSLPVNTEAADQELTDYQQLQNQS